MRSGGGWVLYATGKAGIGDSEASSYVAIAVWDGFRWWSCLSSAVAKKAKQTISTSHPRSLVQWCSLETVLRRNSTPTPVCSIVTKFGEKNLDGTGPGYELDEFSDWDDYDEGFRFGV